jgi:hypothetical protein
MDRGRAFTNLKTEDVLVSKLALKARYSKLMGFKLIPRIGKREISRSWFMVIRLYQPENYVQAFCRNVSTLAVGSMTFPPLCMRWASEQL